MCARQWSCRCSIPLPPLPFLHSGLTCSSLPRSCSKCLVAKEAFGTSLPMTPTRDKASRSRLASAPAMPAAALPACGVDPAGYIHTHAHIHTWCTAALSDVCYVASHHLASIHGQQSTRNHLYMCIGMVQPMSTPRHSSDSIKCPSSSPHNAGHAPQPYEPAVPPHPPTQPASYSPASPALRSAAILGRATSRTPSCISKASRAQKWSSSGNSHAPKRLLVHTDKHMRTRMYTHNHSKHSTGRKKQKVQWGRRV